jgi:DNA-binding CsgD family transcriptional regulator
MRLLSFDIKKLFFLKNEKGASLHFRLFLSFISMLFAVFTCILILLFVTGVFHAGTSEMLASFETELTHLSDNMSNDYGNVSIRGIALSEVVANEIEEVLKENNIRPSNLSNHPEIINTVLNRVCSSLVSGLIQSEGSGVFLILDATVNPMLDNAENSRAGIFLKNMESGSYSVLYFDIRCLYGPAEVVRKQGIMSLPQWKMEFDIADASYYSKPVKAAVDASTPLSRLYYWSAKVDFQDSDSAMLCSVPLIASDGTVMGVVGYEVSSTLFRRRYAPSDNVVPGTFLKLLPNSGRVLHPSQGLYAGKYHLLPDVPDEDTIICESEGKLTHFICGDDQSYKGVSCSVQFYPSGSPFTNENWSIVLMAPEHDIQLLVVSKNRRIIFTLFTLLVLFAVSSYFLSYRYLQPIKNAFNTIKKDSLSGYSKTKIPEIDDLMEFLSTQDKLIRSEPTRQAEVPVVYDEDKYNYFIQNIQELSPAEKAVFELYLDGFTAQQITKELHLSINTIKTHNRRIYMKLNVSSRKELLIYAKVMKEKAKTTEGEINNLNIK